MQFDDVFGNETMSAPNEVTFDNFLTLFPVTQLPINLSSELTRAISELQQPLAEAWVVRFLLETDEWLDDYSEFMPCFRLPDTHTFIALVYWRADLLGNSFRLITFTPAGEVIDRCVLAGTKYEEKELIQTVCTIQPNHTISQVLGRLDAKTGKRLALNKEDQAILQLTTEGDILEL
jgi:hypothetical protein